MLIYFLIFSLLSVFSFLNLWIKNSKLTKILFGIAIIVIGITSGFRTNTGTDWENYLELFNTIDTTPIGGSGFEFLYECLVRIDKLIINDYNFHLLITSFIILLPTSYVIFKHSPYPFFSLLLLWAYSLNSSGFGYRQDISIAICLIATDFALKEKLLPFLLLILIASLIHQSAIFYLFAYWLFKSKTKSHKIILIELFIITGIEFLLFYTPFLNYFLFEYTSNKIENYLLMDKDEAMIESGNFYAKLTIGFLNRLIIILPALIISAKLPNPFLKKLNLVLITGSLIYLGFFNLGFAFTRLARYYEIFFIISIPVSLRLVGRIPKYSLLLFYYILSLFKLYMVLINDKNIYVPYKHIL